MINKRMNITWNKYKRAAIKYMEQTGSSLVCLKAKDDVIIDGKVFRLGYRLFKLRKYEEFVEAKMLEFLTVNNFDWRQKVFISGINTDATIDKLKQLNEDNNSFYIEDTTEIDYKSKCSKIHIAAYTETDSMEKSAKRKYILEKEFAELTNRLCTLLGYEVSNVSVSVNSSKRKFIIILNDDMVIDTQKVYYDRDNNGRPIIAVILSEIIGRFNDTCSDDVTQEDWESLLIALLSIKL